MMIETMSEAVGVFLAFLAFLFAVHSRLSSRINDHHVRISVVEAKHDAVEDKLKSVEEKLDKFEVQLNKTDDKLDHITLLLTQLRTQFRDSFSTDPWRQDDVGTP